MESVTVIMPTYNDEKYIEESLNSCLRQKEVLLYKHSKNKRIELSRRL